MNIALFNKYLTYIKSAGWYLFASLFVAIIGVAINPLMARNLSPNDYAIIGYFTSFNSLLLPLLHFNFITFFLRKYYLIEESERKRTYNTLLIGLIIVGFFVLIAFLGILYLFHKHSNLSIPYQPFAFIVFAQVYVGNMITLYLTKLRIEKKAKNFAGLSILSAIFNQLFSIVLVVIFKYGAEGKLWGVLLATIIFAGYSVVKSKPTREFDISLLKEAFRYGFPLTVSALLWYFISGIDKYMLAQNNDNILFGVYCVAAQITGYLSIVYSSLANAFLPDIYHSLGENNYSKAKKVMGLIIFTVVLINVLFILFADPLIDVLTAGRYMSSIPFARILALQNITLVCYEMVNSLFSGTGHVRASLGVRAIGTVLILFMYYILIKNYSVYGAAWGQVFAFGILSVLGLAVFHIFRLKTRTS